MNNKKYVFIPIWIIFYLIFFTDNVLGSVINAASCGSSDVQTALNSAQAGDIVAIPAGTCNWTSGVSRTVPANVTIQGAGTTANGTEIAKIVAGSYTALAHGAAAWVATDVAYLSAVGTALTAKRNGSNVATATDSSIASGRPGVSYSSVASSGAPAVDNWEAGDFAVTATPRNPDIRTIAIHRAATF